MIEKIKKYVDWTESFIQKNDPTPEETSRIKAEAYEKIKAAIKEEKE